MKGDSTLPACRLCDWLRETPATATLNNVVSVPDAFPLSPGHALILPLRHEPNFFRLAEDEQRAVWQLVAQEQIRLAADLCTDSFNVGLNVGVAGGQTVAHAHVHLVPRFPGDVDDPRGGVRCVIPANREWWRPQG